MTASSGNPPLGEVGETPDLAATYFILPSQSAEGIASLVSASLHGSKMRMSATILSFGCFLAPVSVAHALAPSTYHTAFTPCSTGTFARRKSVLRATVISTRTPSPDEVDELQVSVVPEKEGEEEKKRMMSQNERADNLRQLRRVALARRRQAITEQEDEERDRRDKSFLALALIPCLAAFVSWEQLSLMVAKFTDVYGVLGTEYGTEFANNLLRPTITGVVVPVASIAFATLLSTTVSVLRQRQVDLRVLLNKEACGECARVDHLAIFFSESRTRLTVLRCCSFA